MMRRLIIVLATAAALAASGLTAVHADSLLFYMLPGDYAAYTCPGGSVSATVADGAAYGECTRKGQAEWDVTAYCFGDVTMTLPTSESLAISCN